MRHQAAFIELRGPGGAVQRRWQDRWEGQEVTWQGQAWTYCPFDWSGILAGGGVEDASASLSFPRLPSIEVAARLAAREPWSGAMTVVQWNDGLSDSVGPPVPGTYVIASFRGAFEMSGGSLTQLNGALSSGQDASGRQFPPRVADTALIGTPCVLV